MSPRLPSAIVSSRTALPTINDFKFIKPISRGAFGAVYLVKKVATGDYFAIKALKKSDMIAKNQITNVKAERTILINQASSPFVAKLFFSFQSKDYLYLVMEYLNGGDCATLVKQLDGLSEDWAKRYIAEVVLGLEYLHARNIVHR
jgi:serine/threonine-protein kinase RIM15